MPAHLDAEEQWTEDGPGENYVGRTNFEKSQYYKSERRNYQKEFEEFLTERTQLDVKNNELSQNELDNYLFEANYKKSGYNSETLKKLKKRNTQEVSGLFNLLGLQPDYDWKDGQDDIENDVHREEAEFFLDNVQKADTMTQVYTDALRPIKLREKLAKWRKGAEIRFKMPYYPRVKKVDEKDYFKF